jgi:serine/threonine protein kinase
MATDRAAEAKDTRQPPGVISSSVPQDSGVGPAMAAPAPAVPDYQLLRPVGHGAFGEVWLARNLTGSFVAVKVVRRAAFDHDRPFEREFEGISRFEPISRSDPSQVAILHVGRGEGFFYYVMELADPFQDPNSEIQTQDGSGGAAAQARKGQAVSSPGNGLPSSWEKPSWSVYSPHTLREDLRHKGRLPASECVQIGLGLTRALAHLHQCGLVHRDVKPSNVIFVGGVPKLADIGLVASVDATRSLVGTEGYVAPEGPGTPQADLYSLGKLLYEISTGCDRKEFPALPPDIADRPDRDALIELNAIIVRACQFDPDQRYATAEAMLTELDLVRRGRSIKRQRTLAGYWRLAKKTALPAVLLALVGTGAVLAFLESNRNRPASSNPEAQKLFKQAQWLYNLSTREGNLAAFNYLTDAVRLDTNFIAAYYKLFECYFGPWGGDLPPRRNALENMKWVAEQLRRIQPKSAEYHTVNSLLLFYDWRCGEAIDEAKRALKLNPDFLRAHAFYGWYMLLCRGDAATAYQEYEIAERLDASDVVVKCHRANPYYFERKFSKAIELYDRAVKFQPNQWLVHHMLGRSYEALGQYDKAIGEYEKGARLRGGDPAEVTADFARQRAILDKQGARGWWQANLEEAKKSQDLDYYYMGRLCARLNDKASAIEYLEKALEAREQDMLFLLMDDWWDPLRGDRRFQDIVKRVGLEPKH